MSVLAAVAFLNDSDEKLSTQGGTPHFPQPLPRSASAAPPPPPPPAEKKKVPSLPQQKSKTTTAEAIKELSRIRTGGGAGVASLLSRFGQERQQAPPPNKQLQQKPRQQKPPLQMKTLPIPTAMTPRPTSPPPTLITNPHTTQPITTSPPRTNPSPSRKPSSQVDAIVQELIVMYQESLEQCEAAQKQLKQLQSDAEAYEADSTKVRDYEIRVEYLAQKLEQVSEERDGFERELQQYRDLHGKLDTPLSFEHRLSNIFDKQSVANEEEDQIDDDEEANNELMDGILDAYDNEDNKDYTSEGFISQEDQVAFLTEQLQACDLGAKMAVQQYLSELESERQRSRTLQDVVKKQEALIATLELKCNSQPSSAQHSPAHARTIVSPPPRNASLASPTYTERRLRDQIESQRMELEDKREILTQLLNEREGMRKKTNKSTNSIDRLAELARVDSPSLSPPPRDPLPPLPGTALTSPSKSSGRDSLSSFREDDDGASSLTSWSASSDKNDQGNGFEAMYANYLGPEETNEHHLLALRLLEGS